MFKTMVRKQSIIFFATLLLINSCGGTWDSIKRGLTNQKEKSTDEFLVKKKDPLILPPDFEVLPTPQERAVAKTTQSEIEKLIKAKSSAESEEVYSSENSPEASILKKIKEQ